MEKFRKVYIGRFAHQLNREK